MSLISSRIILSYSLLRSFLFFEHHFDVQLLGAR